MKRYIAGLAICGVLLGGLVGCNGGDAGTPGAITVISREEGSGTRGAFVTLLGIEDDEGDHTTLLAEISNSTGVVLQSVMSNPGAIGYVSFGALHDAVKAVSVDGTAATAENIKAGRYQVSHAFSVCCREENLTELGRDFLAYIRSAQGQRCITDEGYISVEDNAPDYAGDDVSGTLSISGSTSVAAVIEVLAEQYRALHPQVVIDIQQTGSGAGITAVTDGSCEIGMSSRPLSGEELSAGVMEIPIAWDGIAVIVHGDNPVEDLSAAQIREIFTGQITNWGMLD